MRSAYWSEGMSTSQNIPQRSEVVPYKMYCTSGDSKPSNPLGEERVQQDKCGEELKKLDEQLLNKNENRCLVAACTYDTEDLFAAIKNVRNTV